jgi:hypothetical protein
LQPLIRVVWFDEKLYLTSRQPRPRLLTFPVADHCPDRYFNLSKENFCQTLAAYRKAETFADESTEINGKGRLNPRLTRDYTHFTSVTRLPELTKWDFGDGGWR